MIASASRRRLVAALFAAATLTSCAKTRRAPAQPAEGTAPPAPPAASASPVDASALTGDWARAVSGSSSEPSGLVQGLRLGNDGKLTIVGTAPARGIEWKAAGHSVVLSLENPAVGARELSLPVEEASGSRLRLGGSNPAFAGEWRRATFTTVSGTVTYRQRSALTREAEVYVDLRDAGAPAEVPPLVRSRIPTPGQVPVAFTLTYDPASLDPSRSYALSARITDRGELRFVTEHPVTLPTAGDAPPVEIVVGPVR